jgi:hypothetical protein
MAEANRLARANTDIATCHSYGFKDGTDAILLFPYSLQVQRMAI